MATSPLYPTTFICEHKGFYLRASISNSPENGVKFKNELIIILVTTLLNLAVSAYLAKIQRTQSMNIEELRFDLESRSHINQSRWEIKRNACIEAMDIIDLHYVNLMNEKTKGFTPEDMGIEIKQGPQKIDLNKARHVYNELVVVCDSQELPALFIKILRHSDKNSQANIDGTAIKKFRELCRNELGFEKIKLNVVDTWLVDIWGSSEK